MNKESFYKQFYSQCYVSIIIYDCRVFMTLATGFEPLYSGVRRVLSTHCALQNVFTHIRRAENDLSVISTLTYAKYLLPRWTFGSGDQVRRRNSWSKWGFNCRPCWKWHMHTCLLNIKRSSLLLPKWKLLAVWPDWAIFCTLGNFSSLWQQLIWPNLSHS